MRPLVNSSLAPRAVDLAPEIAFLLRHGFSRETLQAAGAKAEAYGLCPARVLVCDGHCTEDRLYQLLARELDLPFAADPIVERTPAHLVLSRCELARTADDKAYDYVVAPRGSQIASLFMPRGRGVAGLRRLAITTPTRLTAAVMSRQAETIARDAAQGLPALGKDWSARHHPTPVQMGALVAATMVMVVAGIIHPDLSWSLAGIVFGLAFLLQAGLRLFVTIRAPRVLPGPRVPPVRDDDLPVYTVLVPLYREAEMVGSLTLALSLLDYPPAKLDIKLLVESDDLSTRHRIEALALQPPFEVVVCPPGRPRTKPRALNIGLRLARGSLVVIYDAEDRPDFDQLRLAAARFAIAKDGLACLQASIAIDNAGDGWLSRHFALEYAQLFDVAIPGLCQLGLPVPLGGTSNHFRLEALREAGAWDAWNVTEDADLGLRLARLGFRVDRLASTTWEEAPARTVAWLKQRRRWLKGWLQTSLVHGTPSWRRIREVGVPGTLAILAHSYCVVLSSLCWPLFTAGFVWSLISGRLLDPSGPIESVAAILAPLVALSGLAAYLWPWAVGAALRGIPLKLADMVLLPLYFTLLSCASWLALIEFLHAPFHWSKTRHGLARRRVERRAGMRGAGARPRTAWRDPARTRPEDAAG